MKENLLYRQHRLNMLRYYDIKQSNASDKFEKQQINDKTRAGLSSNARWSFRASFVKVIKAENSLYLINEDR